MDAAGFDQWYANMAPGSRHDTIQQMALGLPPELESTSLLPWAGIADVVTALDLHPTDVVVDLACGRGGYGLEVARRTGAELIGVDFAAVAVERARQRAAEVWTDVRAEFRVGDLIATGLPAAAAAALMCVDAMQFAEPYDAGLTESLRVLTPGGRLVLTGWEPRASDDETIPARLRHDIASALTAAGFDDVELRDMPAWQQAERAMWQAAVATEPDGDAALDSMRNEGTRVLGWIERIRRVLVTARAPR